MEIVIGLVLVVAVIAVIMRGRRVFRPEIDRARRIHRANRDDV